MTQARIIVIAGPNGAGKSTLAPVYVRDHWGLDDFVNADDIARGLCAFAPESVAFDAGRIMLKRLKALARAGRSFAFETTLATRSYARWLKTLVKGGYEVELVFLHLPSAELAVERVKQRVRVGGHVIEDAVIRRRYERGQRNFAELYSRVVTHWSVLDAGADWEQSVFAFREARSKHAEVRNQALWQRLPLQSEDGHAVKARVVPEAVSRLEDCARKARDKAWTYHRLMQNPVAVWRQGRVECVDPLSEDPV